MAECEGAVVLSAIFAVSGFGLFNDGDESLQLISFPAFIFFTSVFSWISVKNINLFPCKLPKFVNFIYEALVSSLIFELAFKIFWRPLERFITISLPLLVDKYLMKGDCVVYGTVCPGDTKLYTACLYIMAVMTLLVALYGNGFISANRDNYPNPERVADHPRRLRLRRYPQTDSQFMSW